MDPGRALTPRGATLQPVTGLTTVQHKRDSLCSPCQSERAAVASWYLCNGSVDVQIDVLMRKQKSTMRKRERRLVIAKGGREVLRYLRHWGAKTSLLSRRGALPQKGSCTSCILCVKYDRILGSFPFHLPALWGGVLPTKGVRGWLPPLPAAVPGSNSATTTWGGGRV